MAKKKVTKPKQDEKANKDPQDPNPDQPLHRHQSSDAATTIAAAMDDSSSAKLQSLKSLNELLIKETADARKQIESLQREKSSLMADLALGSEVENGVARVFLDAQVLEKVESLEKEKGELVESIEGLRLRFGEICEERDLLESDYASVVEEVRALGERVKESEERERVVEALRAEKATALAAKVELEREFEVLRAKVRELESDKAAKEKLIENLQAEKEAAERAFEALKEQNEEVSRVKRGLEIEFSSKCKESEALRAEISGLEMDKAAKEKVIEGLEKERAIVASVFDGLKAEKIELLNLKVLSDKEVEDLRAQVSGLEKVLAQQDVMIGNLKSELNETTVALNARSTEVCEKGFRIEELVREKNLAEDAKAYKEKEIFELREELSGLRSLCKKKEEINKELVSEAQRLTYSLDELKAARDEAREACDKERKKVESLKDDASKIEKRVKEISDERNGFEEKCKKLESKLKSVEKERDSEKKRVAEEKESSAELRARVKSADYELKKALEMVKKTALIVATNGNDESYSVQLEAIESAFADKVRIVEEMKKEIAALHRSVAAANKGKSFWTLVSSATALLAAAASVAYAKAR